MRDECLPDTTLVLERAPEGSGLFLGGDLQFDTDDEVIYHERLAHPALLAARARLEGRFACSSSAAATAFSSASCSGIEESRRSADSIYNLEVVALAGTEPRPLERVEPRR